MICLECGVSVAKARSGKWLHTEEIPRLVPAHDAVPGEETLLQEVRRVEAESMPLNEARAYAQAMRERMARPEMQGIAWDDSSRHLVVLLGALEEVEKVLIERFKAEVGG